MMKDMFQCGLIGEQFVNADCYEINQLLIAPTICRILGIEPSEKMIKEKFIGLL